MEPCAPLLPTWVVCDNDPGPPVAKFMVKSDMGLDKLMVVRGISLRWFSTETDGCFLFRPLMVAQAVAQLLELPAVSATLFFEQFRSLGRFFNHGAAA